MPCLGGNAVHADGRGLKALMNADFFICAYLRFISSAIICEKEFPLTTKDAEELETRNKELGMSCILGLNGRHNSAQGSSPGIMNANSLHFFHKNRQVL